MLKVYDQNHRQLGWLAKYKDDKVTSELDTGDKTLTFTIDGEPDVWIKNEYYIQNKNDEFVVKKVKRSSTLTTTVECVLNLEALEGTPVQNFFMQKANIIDCATKALKDTGWTVSTSGTTVSTTSKRNVGVIDTTVLGVLQTIQQAWMCEISFNSLNKTVRFREKVGSDRGCYLATGLNLKKLESETSSYDFYTEIYPVGAEGLTIESVNDGKKTLVNTTYSNKKKIFLWKDESYTDASELKADAKKYLADLAKPEEVLTCDLIDLAKQSSQYDVFTFALGDIVTIIDPRTRTRTKQRIVKLEQYSRQPWKNKCELSNRKKKFTDLLSSKRKAEEISAFTIENGAITGVTSLSQIIHGNN